MVNHPATQAQCAATDAPRPRATPASAVELLLLALLRSLLMALLAAASVPAGAAAHLRTRSVLRLAAAITRLLDRARATRAGTWIPRCRRHHEGERQILLAWLYGPRQRPRARPAAMPPSRPRFARDPPCPCHAVTPAHPHRLCAFRMFR